MQSLKIETNKQQNLTSEHFLQPLELMLLFIQYMEKLHHLGKITALEKSNLAK